MRYRTQMKYFHSKTMNSSAADKQYGHSYKSVFRANCVVAPCSQSSCTSMYIPVAARGAEVANCGTSSRKFEFIGVPVCLLRSRSTEFCLHCLQASGSQLNDCFGHGTGHIACFFLHRGIAIQRLMARGVRLVIADEAVE